MKKWMVRGGFLIVLVLVLIPASSFWKDATNGKVHITVEPVFNGIPLRIRDGLYVDQHGDTLSVDMLKFYLTHIAFTKVNSKTAVACRTCSHLIDAEEQETCSFTMNIPEGTYSYLSFMLGVDSVANTSGANDGDLDPAKGMYWAWNTGYIMAKIEGRSKVCKTVHNAYEFHIGGYLPPYNAVREIALPLSEPLVVNSAHPAEIVIKADVAAWFQGVNLTTLNSVVIPGKEAMQMADRYAKMFSVR